MAFGIQEHEAHFAQNLKRYCSKSVLLKMRFGAPLELEVWAPLYYLMYSLIFQKTDFEQYLFKKQISNNVSFGKKKKVSRTRARFKKEKINFCHMKFKKNALAWKK